MRTGDHHRRNSAKRLARSGRIDELRGLAESGDGHAARHLAVWLARTNRLDELRNWMATGDRFARWAYSDWLVRRRRFGEAIDVLRPLAELGISGALRRQARLLAGLGRCTEAMSVLRQAAPRWDDTKRVKGWLAARGLLDRSAGPASVRRDYLDALRGAAAAGDPDARQELSWIVLLWWRSAPPRIADAVALLGVIGESDWLHERLVFESAGWRLADVRAAAIDLLSTKGTEAYQRTRAALLLMQGQRDQAINQLRSLTVDGDRHAQRDLAALLGQEVPQREIRVGDRPNPIDLTGIAFSADGATLATWGHGEQGWAEVILWDVDTETQYQVARLSSPWAGVLVRRDGTVKELPGNPPWDVPHLVTSADGSTRAIRTRGRVRLHKTRATTLARMLLRRRGTTYDIVAPGARAMAFNPDSTLLAVGTGDTGVQLWRTATGRLIRTIHTPTTAVAFHPGGALLATGDSVAGAIRLWTLTE